LKIEIQFKNTFQEEWFNLTARNTCFSGGFQNGKTYDACLKGFTLLSTFRRYRLVIARQVLKDLKATTMMTFWKICPKEFIAKHSDQEGITWLKNGSQVLWMHLDSFDEQSLRGLEINSAILDQAEEIEESVYIILDSRIGRWDQAEVPARLLKSLKNWPITKLGNYKVPTYMMILCNPDTQFHWIYRRYHPDSLEKRPEHLMVQAPTDPNLGDVETMKQMLSRDPEWVRRYVKGEWGVSASQIHYLDPSSILEPTEELLDRIKKKGNLFRILDHGDSAPTCCLWCAALDGNYIFFREYYVPNELISAHRKHIHELSEGETYSANYADPSIFKKSSQKEGGFWTVADEYLTSTLGAPPIVWLAADNNEFATRNRINELLKRQLGRKSPISSLQGEPDTPMPGIYFIKRTSEYPNGIHNAILQIQAQRRLKIGDDNGKAIYSDEREESVADHAYDPVRYFVAMHGSSRIPEKKRPPVRSFAWYDYLLTKRRSLTAASV